jgi:putative flippase GtrA
MVRFAIVGGIATAIQYGVYYLLMDVCGISAALTIGYVVSLVCNFFLTTFFTFGVQPTVRKAGGFAFAHLVNWLLQMVCIHFFVWVGVPKALAPIPMFMVCIPVNFLLVRYFVCSFNPFHFSFLTSHFSFAIVLLLMGVAFYLMCAANPLRWDDLMYQYVWLDHREAELLHPIDLTNRVDNITEAFQSQCNHYVVMNGRFIVHFITQCFCGFIGKGPFNVVNALVYVCFLLLSVRYVGVRSFLGKIVVVAGLWLLLPVQWILSFDVVFPINYLWSATMCLAFLLLFRSVSQKPPLRGEVGGGLLFLFGILCGNFHEGYTLLLSGALFFYTLFHFRKLNTYQWCLIMGMWIGTLTVIGSPGIWGRAAGTSAESVSEMMARKMDILRYSKRLYLLVALLAFSVVPLGKSRVAAFIRDNVIVLTIVLLGLAFLFMLPYYSQRMGFPMELFAVLLTLRLLASYHWKWQRLRLLASMLVAVVLAVHVVMTVGYARQVGDEYRAMLSEYQQSPEGKTHFRQLDIPKPFRPYVVRLDVPFERDQISFNMQKEMIIEQMSNE